MRAFGNLRRLVVLTLDGFELVTDKGMYELRALTNLRRLSLASLSSITDDSIQVNSRLKQDWILKCLQGGRVHPLAARGVATLCCSLYIRCWKPQGFQATVIHFHSSLSSPAAV